MLTKQESGSKELAANKNKTKLLSMIATNKAELETTEAGLTTQQAELEAAQVTLAAELATAQDEKHHLFLLINCRSSGSFNCSISCSVSSNCRIRGSSTSSSIFRSGSICSSIRGGSNFRSSGSTFRSYCSRNSNSLRSSTRTCFIRNFRNNSRANCLQLQKQHKSLKHSQNQLPQRHNKSLLLQQHLKLSTRISSCFSTSAPAKGSTCSNLRSTQQSTCSFRSTIAPAAETPKVSAASTPLIHLSCWSMYLGC